MSRGQGGTALGNVHGIWLEGPVRRDIARPTSLRAPFIQRRRYALARRRRGSQFIRQSTSIDGAAQPCSFLPTTEEVCAMPSLAWPAVGSSWRNCWPVAGTGHAVLLLAISCNHVVLTGMHIECVSLLYDPFAAQWAPRNLRVSLKTSPKA
jgi:hypothetical protein